jgi:hypothetical protein
MALTQVTRVTERLDSQGGLISCTFGCHATTTSKYKPSLVGDYFQPAFWLHLPDKWLHALEMGPPAYVYRPEVPGLELMASVYFLSLVTVVCAGLTSQYSWALHSLLISETCLYPLASMDPLVLSCLSGSWALIPPPDFNSIVTQACLSGPPSLMLVWQNMSCSFLCSTHKQHTCLSSAGPSHGSLGWTIS